MKNKNFLLIAFAITALRIIYLMINHRDLDIDEGQYWVWSKYLAFGYHSKPPMISWGVHFTTWLFGNQEWSIRLLSPITYFFSSIFLCATGTALFNRKVGFWSGITFLLVPGVTYSSTIISTDPLLLMFWSLALYALVKGLQTEKLTPWILCGLAIGLGTLSKYTMLVFCLSAGLYFLFALEPVWRKKGLYVALIIAFLIILPNLIWNYHHQNATFRHVIYHNADLHAFHLHGKNLILFVVAQFGLFGPILTVFFLIALWRQPNSSQVADSLIRKGAFLLCFSMPWLILILIEALLSRAYANWAAVSYMSAILLVVAYMCQSQPNWLKSSNLLHGLALVIFFGWELSLAQGWHHWPHPANNNSAYFGKVIDHWQNIYPTSNYLVDSRDLWSKSLYYGGINAEHLFIWDPLKTIDWIDIQNQRNIPVGQNYIFITHQKYLPQNFINHFMSANQLTELTISKRMQASQDFVYVYSLEDFLGYGKH